jgi:Mrp family chromosome partitioning ATPase
VQALWRRKWIVLVPLVLVPLVTLLASLGQASVYEASADVLVNRQEAATTTLIGQTPALDDPERTMETQVLLASVPAVVERTIQAAGVTGLSPGALRNSSTVFPLADILRFVVSDEDPGRAARLASEYARQFARYRRELDTVGLEATLAQVTRQIEQLEAAGNANSPLYVRLADREQQLESLTALRTSNVSVVQTSTAGDAEQVAPRPLRNAALALVAGLVVGLILVFLWETLSTRPRSTQEFEDLLGMPFLARLKAGRGGSSLLTHAAIGREADAVHTLRTNLELASSAVGARKIMVTSARGGEGKSATTAQLGIALARAGRHVTLVDLDVRSSALTRLMGLDNRRGVTSLVRGECELAEALVAIPLDQEEEASAPAATNGRRDFGALLEVVGSGPLRGHPSETLSSTALASVLAELERRADIVLVETPPLLDAPDAASVATRLDGLLLVVSSRDARGPTLADVRRTVDAWPLAKLGFALTEGGDEPPYGRQLRWGKAPAPMRAGDPEQVV